MAYRAATMGCPYSTGHRRPEEPEIVLTVEDVARLAAAEADIHG
jgi:hypothetical protein